MAVPPLRLPLLLILCAAFVHVRAFAEQPAAGSATIIVLPFTLAGASAAGGDTVCPAGANPAATKEMPAEDQAAVVSVLAADLQTALNKTAPTQVGVPGAALPAGATVISGCITQMDEGDAKKRIIGAGMGASLLAAQVQISRMVDGKLTPLQSFHEESKGRNFGVGSGMLINAMRSKRTSLQGDAGNLADKIAKEYGKRAKSLAEAK